MSDECNSCAGMAMDSRTDDELSDAGSDDTQTGRHPSGYRSPDRASSSGHSHGGGRTGGPPAPSVAPTPRGGAGARRQQYRRGQRPPPPTTPDEILEEQLKEVPGWSKEAQGSEIDPRPPRFHLTANSNSTDWAPYSVGDEGCLFTADTAPRFCRYEMVTVMMAYIANDAERIGDWSTLDDRAQHAQQVACAKLLGMMTMGTSKGLITGSFACLEGLPDAKAREAMLMALERGGPPQNEYTFCPDPDQFHDQALQFSWVFEWIYDESGEKRVAFRVVKAIADPTHSSDELWDKIIRENVEIAAAGQTNSRPESQRDNKLKSANKEQRCQVDPDDLERTVEMQYKTIRNLQDLHNVYACYGGDTGRDNGWPLFPVPMQDLPAGVAAHQLKPHKRWGGECALGPSVALNPLRCVDNATEHGQRFHRGPNETYYCNVALSGLSVGGARLKCHSEQEVWEDYIDPDTKIFNPPKWVVDKKAIFICHKGSIVNIFRARFPSDVAEVTIPDDTLLKMLFELDKDKPGNSISLALEMLGAGEDDSFEALRPAVVSHYSHLVMGRHNAGAANVQAAFANGMLERDTIDMTPGEIQRLDLRSYDEKNVNKDSNWVLEPKQCLKDISIEIRRANDIAVDWNAKQLAEIDAMTAQTDEQAAAVESRDAERVRRYSEAVEACIKMGLNRFEHAYSCKRSRATIPPGWVDVAHHGLHDALRQAVTLSEKDANAQGRKARAVRSTNANAAPQCANAAFLYNRQYVTRDVSPMGTWRTFLFTLFSRCASISGPDIRLMLELWTHAFEAMQEVSFILLFCGGAGSGKSMRAMRMMRMLCKDFIKKSGDSSAKAGLNGGMDHLCGRMVYYDEMTSDFAGNDPSKMECAPLRPTRANCTKKLRRAPRPALAGT